VKLIIYDSVLILDELDHIGKASGSLANLFSVAHEHRDKIRIIGIANTHTLAASGSVFDGVDGVDILHFSAYSGQQLFEIIQTRLAPLYEDEDQAAAMKKFLSVPALNLLSKKIAAQTGDVRAVFEVLRGAIDAAVLSSSVTDAPTVTPANVLAALKVYTPSSTAPATSASSTAPTGGNSQQAAQVRGLGLQQRLVLLSVVLATQRLQTGLSLSSTGTASLPSPPKSPTKRGRSAESNTASIGAGSMDSAALHAFYSSVLTRGDAAIFSPVGRSEFADLLGMLETVGLVSLSAPSAKPGRQMSRSTSFKSTPSKSAAARAQAQDVKLAEGVRLDEVVRGLGCQVNVGTPSGDAPVDLREEEVRALYDREQTRMTRDVRNRASFVEEKNVFADALED
jgi:cell division control protein 6